MGFDEDTSVWRAPGVLTLIGEMRGDVEGCALSFATATGCLTSVMLLDDPVIEIASEQGEDPIEIKLAKVSPALVKAKPEWARPVLSVLATLKDSGVKLRGLAITLDNDVEPGPDFAGLSAVRCSAAAAIAELCGSPLLLADVVRLARAAAVVPDVPTAAEQTCVFSWPKQIILTRGPDEPIVDFPFDLDTENLTILVCDTGVRTPVDAPSEIALRETCATAARLLDVPTLRALTFDDLEDGLGRLESDEMRRIVSHVVSENDRVQACADLVSTGQFRRIGPLLDASHASQRDDFGVSFPEAELAVQLMKAFGAAGARLMGRGGEVVGLMEPSQARAVTIALDGAFGGRGYATPQILPVLTGRGLHKR